MDGMILAIFRLNDVKFAISEYKDFYIICFKTEKHMFNKEGFHSDIRSKVKGKHYVHT
jgi:hypothetical protein